MILANNRSRRPASQGGQVVAAFNAIQAPLNDFAVPPRRQAELIAVTASLPGVRFDREVTDAAGRHGVGLYMPEEASFLQELIFDPATCTYLGAQWIEIRASTGDGTSPGVGHNERGSIIDKTATLGSDIVQRAGQFPGR